MMQSQENYFFLLYLLYFEDTTTVTCFERTPGGKKSLLIEGL